MDGMSFGESGSGRTKFTPIVLTWHDEILIMIQTPTGSLMSDL
jgi:hypothetical protein